MKILMRASQSPFENFDPFETILMDKLWTNAGNLLFPYSLYRNLLSENVSIDYYTKSNPNDADFINEKYDMLLLPFANAFRTNFKNKLEEYTVLIKKVNIPCVVAGVGLQSGVDFSRDKKYDFDDSVKKFCNAVASKSVCIGVRGEITYEYLKRLGFGSVTRIIGCPSMYMFGSELPIPNMKKYNDNFKITVNGKRADGVEIKNFLFNKIKNEIVFIPQETGELQLVYCGVPIKTPSEDIYPLSLDNELLVNNNVRFCINVPQWIELLKSTDFSIGTRIHGSIAAALAGTPLFLIATDSRLLELAQYHNIPHQTYKEFDFSRSIREIYESTDFSAINKGHNERYENFKDFLTVNGMTPVSQPNKFFDNKAAEIQYYPPVKSILNVTTQETISRLNNYYGHLMRKDEKIAKELSQYKKERDELRTAKIEIEKKAENMNEALKEISMVFAKYKIE